MEEKKRVTAEEMLQYAQEHGALSAYDLLMLGGYSFFAGTKEEYDELLKELESKFYWGN